MNLISGDMKEVPKDSPQVDSSDKNLSKILDEECTKNFKSGSLAKNVSHLLKGNDTTVGKSSIRKLKY